jgi:hypothetical protein
MSNIEKNISQFIKNQFPIIYREEGDLFVQFATKYYEWMEQSNNVLYQSRHYLENRDIDETVDDFIIRFKNKYLNDIQIDTSYNSRNLVKHSLDLYRSKGTERAVDTFFRAVYGAPAEVYYPGKDVFRLSDGRWVKPIYLEVTDSQHNVLFTGKQVVGLNSGATAFVERYIKRKIKSKYIHIFYISAINGEFVTGESIALPDQRTLKNIPTVIGSMTSLNVIAGSSGFSVGDIVNISSENGNQGKARVTEIANVTGLVSFDLTDSGWGYTSNAQILVSDKVLTLSNVVAGPSVSDLPFKMFETIKQPLANVVIINGSANVALSNGAYVYTYYANNLLAGTGRVLSYTPSNTAGSTNGEIFVSEVYNTVGPVVQPAANLAGTISVTLNDESIAGYSTIGANSVVVNGTGTSFTTDIIPGQILNLFAYNSNNDLLSIQTKQVSTIVSDTQITLSTNSTTDSSKVVIQSVGSLGLIGTGTSFNTQFNYGDTIAIFGNSSSYVLRTVNAVTNSTYLTIQENIEFTNTSCNYSNVSTNYKIYTAGNTLNANISTRTDKSVTANIMGESSNLTIYVTGVNGLFTNNQIVYQLNANNAEIANAIVVSTQSIIGSNVVYSVQNSNGVFAVGGQPIRSRYANGTVTGYNGSISKIDMNLGIINIAGVGSFTDVPYNYVYGTNSLSNGSISRISTGTLADFSITNSMTYSESILISIDRISRYANVRLSATVFGFPANVTANVTSHNLVDILPPPSFDVIIGGITSLTGINPGKAYDIAPFVTIYEPEIAIFGFKDLELQITNLVGGYFSPGELVSQDSGARGIVKDANSTNVSIKRLNFANNFLLSEAITGSLTGSYANVISFFPAPGATPIGLNAVVSSNVQTASGSVSKLDVYDSGFGYLPNEIASFVSGDGARSGTTKINLGRKGIAEGFYKNKNGQLSASKYIHDGDYYQDFSYEIITEIHADKYADMLKKVLHVAGTKFFSSTIVSDIANNSTNIITTITKDSL